MIGNYLLTVVSLIFFTLDVLFKFSTAYYDDGVLIIDRKKIIIKYFRLTFWIDICALIPLFLCPLRSLIYQDYLVGFHHCYAPWMKLLFMLKLYQVNQIYDFWDEVIAINEKIECILMLIKLILKMILMIHVFACLWHLASSYNQNNNWIISLRLENADWNLKYIYSLYWSAATIITVGYGDVIPSNTAEFLLSIVAMILGCGVFGYSLNSLGTIINKFNKSESELK